MAILGESIVRIFGQNFVFLRCGYTGVADSVVVDAGATSVALLSPSSGGPTVSLGSSVSSTGTKTITIAGGGASAGGAIILVVKGGKTVGGFKGEL